MMTTFLLAPTMMIVPHLQFRHPSSEHQMRGREQPRGQPSGSLRPASRGYHVSRFNNGRALLARKVIITSLSRNMDGTALYEAVAAIYIAQTVGHPMTFGDVVLVRSAPICVARIVAFESINNSSIIDFLRKRESRRSCQDQHFLAEYR